MIKIWNFGCNFERIIRYFFMRLLLLFCIFNLKFLGQKIYTDSSNAVCDCKVPKLITIDNSKIIKHIKAPNCGGKNGIKATSKNKHYAFEKEHHTNWYKLLFKTGGNFCFTIKPFKKDDDYDFMIFKSVSGFCDSLLENNVFPIRANISRDKKDIEGFTGLNSSSKIEFVKQGIGDAFSKSIPAKPSDEYYLVIDNVYDKGEGFTLELFFETQVNIKGRIVNENDLPIKAEVTINNNKGNELAKVYSDSITGMYQLDLTLKNNQAFTLNYFKDNSFFFSRTFEHTDTALLKPINQILPQLKKGLKYSVGAINFEPGSPEYLASSLPAIKNLTKLMKKNQDLSIVIIGHTNGCGNLNSVLSFNKTLTKEKTSISAQLQGNKFAKASKKDSASVLKLSLERANKIKKYLMENKISPSRISTLGKGCKEMLYPFTEENYDIPWWQQEANRRVEIMIKE
jgi:outer membrane protein OmpA-like peptidoglycan-associated protein